VSDVPKVFRVAAECGAWHVYTAEPAYRDTEYTFVVSPLVPMGDGQLIDCACELGSRSADGNRKDE
jgi:hypothetical protein